MVRDGDVELLLESEVAAISPDVVTVTRHGETLELANDVVIICAGGVVPTGLLKDLGVRVETKYGQA